MSYLSNELQKLLKNYGLKQRDVTAIHVKRTKKGNLGESKVSRLCSGSQTEVRIEDLDDLSDVVAQTDAEKAALLKARVYDAIQPEKGRYSHLIKVMVKGGANHAERFTPKDASHAPPVRLALEKLAAHALVSKQGADAIVALANLIVEREQK